jgi:oxygen-dependent protoporphyrinogen oxidase
MQVVIVGAGISGLAAAYRLQQVLPTAEVTVLEQSGRPGGTVWTDRRDGFQIETGPNGFLDTKPSTADLCRDVDLAGRLIPATEAAARNRYLFVGGRLRALPAGLRSFLTSDLLSWRGKLSLLLERFRRGADGLDESVGAFVRRRAGPEAAGLLADALVTGIYAGDPELLSAPAAFPRLATLEREHGSITRGMAAASRRRRREAAARGAPVPRPGRMWTFREGLRLLVETLSGRLARPPLLGARARGLRRRGDGPGWVVAGEGHEEWAADAVLLTCPAYQQAALLAELDPPLADEVAAIPYNRVTVVGLGYRREDVPGALDGFGFIALQRDRRDLLGVQWCSSIFPGRAPPGMVLLRALCGGWHRPDAAAWGDDRLLEAVRAELRPAMGITAAPVLHHIVRWERAIPQYHVGHLERVARVEARLARHPGLFVGGNAYRGVALNDCTEQAVVLAERMRSYLPPPGGAVGGRGLRQNDFAKTPFDPAPPV